MTKPFLAIAGSASALALAVPAMAENAAPASAAVQQGSGEAMSAGADFARFTPRSETNANRIDYTVWDEALQAIVFRMGRSLREGAPRPEPGLGSRRIYGHQSRYRLEGNRVIFSFFEPEVREQITAYRQDLEETARLADLTALARNEQLAYWINLHNVALIEQIAGNWPVRQPQYLQIDGVPLDEAKIVTVDGVALSPKDIRTKIVYPNWKDPKVLYGFWRGDIGGPSIQGDAYTAENVGRLLARAARDFVNSLRGVQESGDTLQVSRIYEEAAPFYFPDYEADLRAHLAEYADEEVTGLLAKTQGVESTIYEADIADLAGGVREPTYSQVTTTAGDGIERQVSFRVPQAMGRLLREQAKKVEKLIEQNRQGRVFFSNIALPGDPESDNGEVE